jgi:hypothetical protein
MKHKFIFVQQFYSNKKMREVVDDILNKLRIKHAKGRDFIEVELK